MGVYDLVSDIALIYYSSNEDQIMNATSDMPVGTSMGFNHINMSIQIKYELHEYWQITSVAWWQLNRKTENMLDYLISFNLCEIWFNLHYIVTETHERETYKVFLP